jgi:predicted O-methyltransferase YrrM
MNIAVKIGRNIRFVKKLWSHRVSARTLLESQNYVFLSDFPPGHFYSPIPDLSEIRKNANTVFDRSAKQLPEINMDEASQLRLLGEFAKQINAIPFADRQTGGYRYFFDNPYFSYGDGIILYSILRHFKPRRVVEVGSGFSSSEMLDINDRFFDKRIEFTFIEPYPERLYGLFTEKDSSRHQVVKAPVQSVAVSSFTTLEADDILFIDSSHIGKTGSDVLHILFNILPLLRPGVLVHFHDILWPFEYPQSWIEEGRAWNEAYFLRAFLQYNTAFEILFFNSFMALQHEKAIREQIPAMLKSPSTKETIGNSSLWLRKVK